MTRTIARPRPALDPSIAAALVRKCESAHATRMAALVCLGLPLCLLGPLFITTLLWMHAGRTMEPFNFAATFWTVTAVALPFLFILAAAVKGSVIEAGADSLDTDSLGGNLVARRAALPMLVMELGNIGPRMVLHFVRRTTARRRAGRVPPDRLATALCALAAAGGSLPPATLLLLPNEPADTLEPLLAVLLFHDLADISKTGDRIWLTTPARTKLASPPTNPLVDLD